jgi:7-carboxy-7-deazaguanine synthase
VSEPRDALLGIVEIFATLQGEGAHAGRAAVFVRLAGCNLRCTFCDTNFALRRMLSITAILSEVARLDPSGAAMVVLTGGEPLAQSATAELIAALTAAERRVHIESNGSIPLDLPESVWLTLSPKERVHPRMAARANEVKCIVDRRVPLEWREVFAQRPIYLQPESNRPKNIQLAVEAILREPAEFRLSLQTHKFIGIP